MPTCLIRSISGALATVLGIKIQVELFASALNIPPGHIALAPLVDCINKWLKNAIFILFYSNALVVRT